MKLVGIIKDVDKLGRIVIPKALRDRYEIKKQIEIIAVDEGILIRNPQKYICEKK